MIKLSGCILVAAALLGSPAAWSDDSPVQRVQDTDPKLPPPNEQVPEKIRPEAGQGGTLSDKLERSDGVIKPPGGVDPEIRTIAPEPSPNSMPVIKPPGNAR